MPVAGCDTVQQAFKIVFMGYLKRDDADFAIDHPYFDRAVAIDSSFIGQCFRNPQRKAVAPFLDFSLHGNAFLYRHCRYTIRPNNGFHNHS